MACDIGPYPLGFHSADDVVLAPRQPHHAPWIAGASTTTRPSVRHRGAPRGVRGHLHRAYGIAASPGLLRSHPAAPRDSAGSRSAVPLLRTPQGQAGAPMLCDGGQWVDSPKYVGVFIAGTAGQEGEWILALLRQLLGPQRAHRQGQVSHSRRR